ncbi:hypothetical protein [Brazilian marseillevirus]|uniref:hypothetical protein n=1 Tax=Brazilian marseillevirus TaxID=1813599 RepID=UPI000781B51D|nr:hypothetical protein A3303_gp400 [Brazilian marseillevirus]AMQ10908.1 hypothetical protein [Brazilian marseillevirus]
MEKKTFVCRMCGKETLEDDGSTTYQTCGVCMRATKGPMLTKEDEDWLFSELRERDRTRKRYVPFFGFVDE